MGMRWKVESERLRQKELTMRDGNISGGGNVKIIVSLRLFSLIYAIWVSSFNASVKTSGSERPRFCIIYLMESAMTILMLKISRRLYQAWNSIEIFSLALHCNLYKREAFWKISDKLCPQEFGNKWEARLVSFLPDSSKLVGVCVVRKENLVQNKLNIAKFEGKHWWGEEWTNQRWTFNAITVWNYFLLRFESTKLAFSRRKPFFKIETTYTFIN